MKNVIIMGAAGRDFHDFLSFYKDNKEYRVVAFTAEQIPGISKRKFPASLAGRRYPKGIPIYKESELPKLIKRLKVDEVVLSYSDLSHENVMHKASIVLAAGASFRLLSYHQTKLKSKKPIISVCAVRTGCGKSQVSRRLAEVLKTAGKRVTLIRHPMPYGDLAKQKVQRFATPKDLDKHKCTIEEREEYRQYVDRGFVIYAGVDYKEILKQAEKESDVIIWDGGNNDVPFYQSDLHIVVVDPHRAGHALQYHPGEENFRLADVIIINKMDTAIKKDVETVLKNIRKYTNAEVVKANSKITVDNPKLVRNKRVLVVEDGPTLTHGGMAFGAGAVAAKRLRAKIVNPKGYASGSLKNLYVKYPTLGHVLPAMGYSKKQMAELQATINKAGVDAVIDGSPANLSELLKINKPMVNVSYELDERGKTLKSILKKRKFI